MADVLPWQFRALMTMAQLASYLGKPSGEAARKWVGRNKRRLPVSYCGRELRVDKRDVDRLLCEDTTAARNRRAS